MKPYFLPFLVAATYAADPAPANPPSAPAPASTPSTAAAEIDWQKARSYLERERRGDALTPEEKAYLDRAKAIRRPGGPPRGAAMAQRKAPERMVPLTDLGAEEKYEGQDGGLYGGGKNTPPEAHAKAAQERLAKLQPLDANGQPSPDGKIVLVSLSMSNATQEFSTFVRLANADPAKHPKVTIVDCAQGGQAMAEWAPRDARPWTEAFHRLERAGVTKQQVQVAWVKLANKGPSGSLEEHGRKLERDTLALLQNARVHFPNLRVAYLGSRTFGGFAVGGLNPEPYAYESAFPARWLIQRQIAGDPELAEAKAPLLLWGPYLWAEGPKGRKTDELVWERSDFVADGVHPSPTGRDKVARLLLKFFTTDPLARSWFAK